MSKKYFGTDGIRGRVGEPPITPDFMLKLGWAAGKVFQQQGKSKILIGKDTRISGYMFEAALEAGLVAAGADVRLVGPMPTPAIAYLTRTFHAQAGIVISASHNPFDDNGIKFFSGEGKKLDDDIEHAIERMLDEPMVTVPAADLGKAVRIEGARGRYIEFCKSTVPTSLDLSGLHIVVDAANGACYNTAPDVFDELGARVTKIATEPDGFNINRDCGSTHPAKLQAKVRELGADLGVALDGDGDRLIMVDAAGEVVDGDELLFIIARDRHAAGSLGGGVVGTLMSNFGMELALQKLGIPFARAKVGDRYVMAELEARGWLVGGESSGHIVCLDRTTTGDGTLSALQVLAALARSGQTLAEARRGMSKLPQVMINVPLTAKRDVAGLPEVKAAVAAAESSLAGRGRVLLLPSGTEPLVRVMVEGEDADLVGRLVRELAARVAEHA
ncbi:MAG: phosphoglucosamine mutase [Gammaproteobacteria bacterium]